VRQSQVRYLEARLELWLWSGKFAGDDQVGEAAGFVGAVAEGFVRRVAAATEADGGASGEVEGVAGGVDDFEVAFNADRAVAIDGDFG
jgi:hypothetical protein